MEVKAFKYKEDSFVAGSWWDDYYVILTLVRSEHTISRVMSERVFEKEKDIRCDKMIKQLDDYEKGIASVADTFLH